MLVAVLALLFTVASFWWLYARRGSLEVGQPGAYAFASKVRLRLPLAFYNTGARSLIVTDLQVLLVDDPAQPPGDVAYLSRQARPDGNGSFILLTGIHAVGSHGIIDFLRRELADLYEQVDLQPFSTLIATEYDPVTRQLVRSERIAPLYQHQEP